MAQQHQEISGKLIRRINFTFYCFMNTVYSFNERSVNYSTLLYPRANGAKLTNFVLEEFKVVARGS